MRVPKDIMAELVTRWRTRLNLQAWEIRWKWTDKQNDADGLSTCKYGTDIADICIDACVESNFERVRHVLIHELMHVRIERLVTVVERLEHSDVFTPTAWSVFSSIWLEQMEKDVDALATVFSDAPGEWADKDLEEKFRHSEQEGSN